MMMMKPTETMSRQKGNAVSDENKKDARPDPKPRKRQLTWQHYLLFIEFRKMRLRHELRLNAIEKGKSNLHGPAELHFLDDLVEGKQGPVGIRMLEKRALKDLIDAANSEFGAIYEWLVGIHGIGDSTAAQLLAMIDDIGRFDTVSKLWRYLMGAVMDIDGNLSTNGTLHGRMERSSSGEKNHFSREGRALCWNIADSLIKAQKSAYVAGPSGYYADRERMRELYPEPIPAVKGENVPTSYRWKELETDSHQHRKAKRKVAKTLLRDLWLEWREIEGLPITKSHEDRELEQVA
jgi:hypothetical protein